MRAVSRIGWCEAERARLLDALVAAETATGRRDAHLRRQLGELEAYRRSVAAFVLHDERLEA